MIAGQPVFLHPPINAFPFDATLGVLRSESPTIIDNSDTPQDLLSLASRIENPCWACFVMGGTSTRMVLLKGDGSIRSEKISWDQFRELHQGQEIAGKANEFVEYLGERFVQFIRNQNVEPKQLEKVAISAAGLVRQGNYSSTNTDVEFDNYPLGEKLRASIYQSLVIKAATAESRNEIENTFHEMGSIEVKNDADAGKNGERKALKGKLRGVEKGIYVILGTGAGSAGDDPRADECGHTLLLDLKTSEYFHAPLDRLAELGLLKNNHYLEPNSGLEYFETRCAGPFMAQRFVEKIFVERPDLLNSLMTETGLSTNGLLAFIGLMAVPRTELARHLEDRYVLPISKFILGDTNGAERSELFELAREFKRNVFREWGQALGTLSRAFPGQRIVVGSSLAERSSKDPEFAENFYPAAQCGPGEIVFSELDALEREAVGALDGYPQS